jgi:hypothetical protein
MGKSHRIRIIVALAGALVLVATAAACSAQTTAGSLSPSSARAQSASGSGAGAKVASGGDFSRVLRILASMRAVKPAKPVVVLLGGSAARESTISDSSWRSQIEALGGPPTLAWNMGSRNRTMAQNVAIVNALPKGVHAIVFIGINLGSFTSAQKTASISVPSPAPTSEPELQQPHQYSTKTGTLTTTQKKAAVRAWLSDRYPVFKGNFGASAGVLEKLITLCKTRGYKPVLFELPRNTAIIGSSLDAPTTQFRNKCVALHKKYGVPWVSLVTAAKLQNQHFYDLWHLVEPGRTVWQKLLSAKTAALLKQYGYAGGGR